MDVHDETAQHPEGTTRIEIIQSQKPKRGSKWANPHGALTYIDTKSFDAMS